jgi:hypothetical protein
MHRDCRGYEQWEQINRGFGAVKIKRYEVLLIYDITSEL